jgi:hypothetical protein
MWNIASNVIFLSVQSDYHKVDFLLPVLWMKLNVLAVVYITEIGNLRIFHIYCYQRYIDLVLTLLLRIIVLFQLH